MVCPLFLKMPVRLCQSALTLIQSSSDSSTVAFNPTVIPCIACCLHFLHPVSKIIQFVQSCRKDTASPAQSAVPALMPRSGFPAGVLPEEFVWAFLSNCFLSEAPEDSKVPCYEALAMPACSSCLSIRRPVYTSLRIDRKIGQGFPGRSLSDWKAFGQAIGCHPG